MDSRLFNQEQLSGSFADEDSYNLYDRPLFQGSSAAAAIYKPMANQADDDEAFGGGNEEGIKKAMANDRFGLGVAGRGFEGAAEQEVRLASYRTYVLLLIEKRRTATRRTGPIREGFDHIGSVRCQRVLGRSKEGLEAWLGYDWRRGS